MSINTLNTIIDDCITEAARERSMHHAILPVGRAVNMALLRSAAGTREKPEVCRMICYHAIKRGFILQFSDE